MMAVQKDLQIIPISLGQYMVANKLVNPFKVYLALKYNFDGWLRLDQEFYSLLANTVGIKSKLTIDNHLRKLTNLNFIGIDYTKNVIYVRSIFKICEILSLDKRHSIKVQIFDLKHLSAHLVSGVLTLKLQKMKYFFEHLQKIILTAEAGKSGASLQAVKKLKKVKEKPLYYGYALKTIGKMFGFSKSTASRMISKCHKLKLIKKKFKFDVVEERRHRDFTIKTKLERAGYDSNRMRFKKVKRYKRKLAGQTESLCTYKIQVLEQKHNELIPLKRIVKRRNV